MVVKASSAKQRKDEVRSDPTVSYNDFKEFEGQRYTGMKIGRSHKWYYDRGRMEGNENHARLVAGQLCGYEATRRTRPRGIRCAGRHRVPLVCARTSKYHQTNVE